MHIKSIWSYINKGLLAILSFLVVSSLASIIYLSATLLDLYDLTRENGNATGTAFVLQDMLINLQQSLSSVRGYVVTADNSFLELHNIAVADVDRDVRVLKTNQNLILTDDQISRVDKVVDNFLVVMRQQIGTRQSQGFEAAQSLVQAHAGEEALEAVRQELTAISSSQLQELGPMQQRAEHDIRRTLIVAASMSILVLATSGAVIWYFRRAILHERALDSTKNEFLSLASHQLRTPATNVKQYIGMLLDGYMGDLNDQQRSALKVAYKSNDSEINIINALLDVAKLDLERIQLHKKVTNIMTLARAVVKDCQKVARERNQKIRLTGAKQVMALVDENYIKGVIENLIDNALKYSKENTTVSVKIDRQGDSAIIAVRDQGVGIRKRDVSKLFNKFSRLDNEFSANSEGSGLGLYWVRKVVQLHYGTVEVDSREGKGSTFKVKLPVR